MISIDVGTAITVTVNETMLNIHNSQILLERMKEVFREHEQNVVIDLANVTFLDSSIIAVFVQFNNLLKDSRRELSFTNLTPFVRRIFEMLHLSSFFKIS